MAFVSLLLGGGGASPPPSSKVWEGLSPLLASPPHHAALPVMAFVKLWHGENLKEITALLLTPSLSTSQTCPRPKKLL